MVRRIRFLLVNLWCFPILLLALCLLSGCAQKPDKPSVLSTKYLVKLEVDISQQQLTLKYPDGRKKKYPVSTAARGIGQAEGSMKTPLGKHVVIDKVGDGLPWNAMFRYGEFTGKYYDEKKYKELKDPILSRIIRISGVEKGFNSGAGVDTENRRIYIHGTPPSQHPEEGVPRSKGCIRMSGEHMIDLYKRVPLGAEVIIKE